MKTSSSGAAPAWQPSQQALEAHHFARVPDVDGCVTYRKGAYLGQYRLQLTPQGGVRFDHETPKEAGLRVPTLYFSGYPDFADFLRIIGW